jgi:hypothetical protein
LLLIILLYNIGTPDIVKKNNYSFSSQTAFFIHASDACFLLYLPGIAADVVLHMLSKVLATLKTDH